MGKEELELTKLNEKISEISISKQKGGTGVIQMGEQPKQEGINMAYLQA